MRHLNSDAAQNLLIQGDACRMQQDCFLQSKQLTSFIRGEGCYDIYLSNGLMKTRKTLQGLESLWVRKSQYCRAT